MYARFSIIFYFLALADIAVGQQLPKGTFILSTGFTYTEFTFKNNASFEYKYSSCTGGEEGIGTYTFKKRQLVLTFENPKEKPLPTALTIARTPTQSDSSSLSFNFFDQKDTSEVAGVRVKFLIKSNGKTHVKFSDSVGHVNINIKNTDLPVDLEISYIGIKPNLMRIDTSGNYSIAYPLNFEFLQTHIKGDILQFIIDDYDDDEIVLKPIKEKTFRTFTRKED